MATKKASQASGYMSKISSLEEKVSSLMVKVVHNEEYESFILGIVESACEMLRYKFSFDSSFPCLCTAIFVKSFAVVGTCLDFAAEERRVAERNTALAKMSTGCETLWSDPRRWSAIVLLQDRVQHIGKSVDSC
jgi:hypothetical protein